MGKILLTLTARSLMLLLEEVPLLDRASGGSICFDDYRNVLPCLPRTAFPRASKLFTTVDWTNSVYHSSF